MTPATLVDGALRLHYNENTAGCSPAVLDAIRALTREDVGLYLDSHRINAQVEAWLRVEPGWVQVTNGLDEGIQAAGIYGICHFGERLLAPEVVIVDPAFEVYEGVGGALGARVVRIPPQESFRFPLEELIAAVTPATRVIYLTDPNNPTGLGIPAGMVQAIAEAVPQAVVLVDEAYADFSGRTLIGPLLERCRNLVVGRTFAKGHGLAGLRIGAIIAHPDTMRQLQSLLLPFNVSVFAMTALSAALANRTYLDWYVGEAAASREAIYEFCRRHGLTCWPSEANFVLLRVGPNVSAVVAELARRRILVRDKSALPGCAGCIRLTAGVLAHTTSALSALEDILASPRTR